MNRHKKKSQRAMPKETGNLSFCLKIQPQKPASLSGYFSYYNYHVCHHIPIKFATGQCARYFWARWNLPSKKLMYIIVVVKCFTLPLEKCYYRIGFVRCIKGTMHHHTCVVLKKDEVRGRPHPAQTEQRRPPNMVKTSLQGPKKKKNLFKSQANFHICFKVSTWLLVFAYFKDILQLIMFDYVGTSKNA